jgi:hypothetical protein
LALSLLLFWFDLTVLTALTDGQNSRRCDQLVCTYCSRSHVVVVQRPDRKCKIGGFCKRIQDQRSLLLKHSFLTITLHGSGFVSSVSPRFLRRLVENTSKFGSAWMVNASSWPKTLPLRVDRFNSLSDFGPVYVCHPPQGPDGIGENSFSSTRCTV